MKIFIDESGTFNWTNPGLSLFCGVTIPDRDYSAVIDRFVRWRRSIIGDSTRELKGNELSDAQLNSFALKVLPGTDRDVWLTVQGFDTMRTKKHVVEGVRDQAAVILQHSSELMEEHNNPKGKERYRQMSGWVKSRSPENVAWIIVLHEAIRNSLQHTIVRFMEPEDDSEFNEMRIQIDQSFVKRDEHIIFWREWLRNDLRESARSHPTTIPNTWRARSHPYIKAYSIRPGLENLTRLFVRDTGFFSSEKSQGLQIADICAHVLYRYHRGNGARDAYQRLRLRIVCEDGAEMNGLDMNDDSLHKDDLRNHVGIFNRERYEREADEFIARQR
jgi:hypothetical protein